MNSQEVRTESAQADGTIRKRFITKPPFAHKFNRSDPTSPKRLHPNTYKNSTMTANSKQTDALTTGVSHVGLSVFDLDASLKFFEALGYKKVGGSDSYPSIFVSDGSSLITLWKTDDDYTTFDRRKNVGLHHLATKVPSLQALDKAYHSVNKVRVDGEGAFAPKELEGTPLTHAIIFEPSGNRIELTYHQS